MLKYPRFCKLSIIYNTSNVWIFMWLITVLSWNCPESDPNTRIWVQVTDLGGRQVRQAREGSQYRVRSWAGYCLSNGSHAPWGLLGACRGQASDFSQLRGEVVNLLVPLPLVNGWGLFLGVITSWHIWPDPTPMADKAFRPKVPVACT